ncbi:stalk domain-containing protein [Marinicrinis sediminis]|uniref:Stalk domain-containing protein n=1 Tax=Marinicrinis sediminis TaxID=1652465 RepID=A0ABW5R7L3_9BACL
MLHYLIKPLRPLRKRWLSAALAATLGIALMPVQSPANVAAAGSSSISATTSHVLFYLGNNQAYINNEEIELDSPATAINGSTYLPVKFLADSLGLQLSYDAATKKININNEHHFISLDQANNTVMMDGIYLPFNSIAVIRNNRLMVKMTWLADLVGAKYNYKPESKRIELIYVGVPKELYDQLTKNSLPVAKFATDKKVYQIGEPIQYIDLSYDPDGDPITYLDWKDKQQAFFEAGSYKVSLIAKDSKGNYSEPYEQTITVTSDVHLSKEEFPLYHQPVGSVLKLTSQQRTAYKNVKEMNYSSNLVTDRPILFSDSPETITDYGILYHDGVSGKARLYANHVNGMDQVLQLMIIVENTSDKSVKVKVTNKGEAYPSVYAQLFGQHAALDFMLNKHRETEMSLEPGEKGILVKMPKVYPAQGTNMMYDIETDGSAEVYFAAMEWGDSASNLDTYPPLPYVNHIRGTFVASSKQLRYDGAGLTEPAKLSIGDGKLDPFTPGFDPMRGIATSLTGNYGVTYELVIERPEKMAVLLVPRGGNYKGPVAINGVPQMVPKSGILNVNDGAQLIARTKGTEKELKLELIPAAGSSLPVNLLFFPLDEQK